MREFIESEREYVRRLQIAVDVSRILLYNYAAVQSSWGVMAHLCYLEPIFKYSDLLISHMAYGHVTVKCTSTFICIGQLI